MKNKHRYKLSYLAEDLVDSTTDVGDAALYYAGTDDIDDLLHLIMTWNQAVDDLIRVGEYIEKHAVDEIFDSML